MELPIYLDHAATTPVHPLVVETMLPYFTRSYGNPASLYSVGMEAREGVEFARETVAAALNASPDEIVFNSGGTEADNTALWGAAQANLAKGKHLLTAPIEHHAVLETLETLAHHGWDLEFLPVDGFGRVDPADVAARLRPDTVIVSVMHGNNEIGTLQPIAEIGAICRERGVLFHTDAVQTFGKEPLDVRAMNIDLLSISSHKLYGPKGIGALYIRRGTPVARFQEGGEQERGRRGGTLNVPGIVGLGKATELSMQGMKATAQNLSVLRDHFFEQLIKTIPDIRISGHRTERMANNVHVCIEGLQGEALILSLDAAGICASAGSACSSGSTEPSHVLKAIGVPRDTARGALRLTLGASTTVEALDYTLDTLASIVHDLRSLSRRSMVAAG